MDRRLRGYYDSMNSIKFNDEAVSVLSDQNLAYDVKYDHTLIDRNSGNLPQLPPDMNISNFSQSFSVNPEGDSHEDCDFSDVVLKYINQMLMEEDMEEKTCMFHESAALQAAEKSFYEVLGEKYPPADDHPTPSLHRNAESPNEKHVGNSRSYSSSNSSGSDNFLGLGWSCDLSDYESPLVQSDSIDHASRPRSQFPVSSSCSTDNIIDGLVDSPVSTLTVTDIFSDSRSLMHFKRGVEEASKFLPNGNGNFVDLGNEGLLVKEQKEETKSLVIKVEQQQESEDSHDESRGKKNPYPEDVDLKEGRSNKQAALYTESTERSELFDLVLLCDGDQRESALREALKNKASKNMQQNGQTKGSNGGKVRGKKQGGKRDVVDLRTLLTICAQAVAADDIRSANELLKQIRQHSSPTGDGMQRLAHYFASGLEARMAGSGTEIYRSLITLPTSAADVLKAYHLYLATCPFRKASNFFSNKTIMDVAEKRPRLHIVDFGIMYGFQWPAFIQRLSLRPGGPPKLRITGIDLPNPGFRPSERVEETGRRLAHYAETFKVPFEFTAIAQKWETVQIEDLKIDRDEVLVVNCIYRFRNLLDETVVVKSPRNIVLNLIRKMNPDVFIQGIVNGSFNAPFFITRFREAFFHYSTLFDMLEAVVPREIHERMLIEKTIFGREAMNVIACEGAERIERPETYKQWQVQNMRAGLRQLPLNQEIMNIAKDKGKLWYHKDFVIDKDGDWMLQGWKGRIVYALSSWRSAY